MKNLWKSAASIFAPIFFACSLTSGIHAQAASPGPYEYLPFNDAFIVEAFRDLLAQPDSGGNVIADWTGYKSSQWISPHAYNGHGGNDFSMGTGTPIYATTDGVVIEVVHDQPEGNHSTEYGNFVKIKANGLSPRGEQLTVLTAHMLPNVQVAVNDTVTAGQLIGYSDNTGNSTSEHCHVQSALFNGNVFRCPFFHGHWKYPIMFNPNARVQVGHVLEVRTTTPIHTERFGSSPIVKTALPGQLYFASISKRGYYCVFLNSDLTRRAGWIKAMDVAEVFEGTVIQTLPDPGAHPTDDDLNAAYTLRASPNDQSQAVGTITQPGVRFVADQTAPGGWYRIPVSIDPGNTTPAYLWGWVKADANMVVYPELYNPAVNLAAAPSDDFPLIADFDTLGEAQFGRPKFVRNSVKSFSPASPGGDGKALFLTDAVNSGSGIYDTVRIGRPEYRNYYVEADVYFNYQPSYIQSGTFERYGIFIRDDGFGGFDETFEGAGNCYAMTWDCDDGYLRCCKIVDAVETDFPTTQIYVKSDGWHKMRIEAEGDNIRYYLDNVLQESATDDTFISGPCGMGYSGHVGTTYPPERGAYFDNFKADLLPGASVSGWGLY